MKHARGYDLELALDLIDYVTARRMPFTVDDLAAHFGVHRRTAYRWLSVLEHRQMIDPVRKPCRGKPMCQWVSRVVSVPCRELNVSAASAEGASR